MERPKRKITLSKKYAERIMPKVPDPVIPCIFCFKPVDSKNHFIFEQSSIQTHSSNAIPQVCDSPLCLAKLISSNVCKTEIESEDDDEGFIGFSNDANSTENWVNK